MRVKFEEAWFAPTVEVQNEGKLNRASGTRYKKGIHEIPEMYRHILPKRAKILDDKSVDLPAPSAVLGETLRDFDDLRLGSEMVSEIKEKAEATADAVVFKRGPGRPRKEVSA